MAQKRSIKAFLVAVIDLERQFGMSIAHEDSHGAFIVQNFNDGNAKWLKAARNETDSLTQNEVLPDRSRPQLDLPKIPWRIQ